ncbi:MAG: SIMPL domain-containing protein [Flavisolibacter sp.]
MRCTGHLIIAAAIIIGIIITAATIKYKFRAPETISVTGLAEKDFMADEIVWKGTFSRSGMDLKAAYASLKSDESVIRQYLNEGGINDSSILFSSVDMQRNYETVTDAKGNSKSSVFNGYTLTGTVTVDSRNIFIVEKLSREITGLLQKGIELNSTAPGYYYSRLNELKIDLLARAATDARQRAESIARNSGAVLGKIKKANMGVFQITGKNSNEEFSYGGAFNISSRQKTASITLKVDYQLN